MADIVLNDALGRIIEKIADGADIRIVPMSAVDADGTLKDAYAGGSDLATVLAEAGNTEQSGSSWERRQHLNSAITITVDDPTDKVILILDADDTWSAVAAANDVVALLICEDGVGDANINVLTKHDFSVTTDGNDVTADYDQTNGIFQAS